MPPRSTLPLLSTSSDARTAMLQGLVIATIVIGGLYVGREVLLPLALAILLNFVLTPPLLLLRRIKVPRVVGVAIVVSAAFAIIGGLGWLISLEARQLASDLPGHAFREDRVVPRKHKRIDGAGEGGRGSRRPSGATESARAQAGRP
ncbi:MAG: hypothetical protein ACREDO_11600 [Methyloceanibacter sp.]